MDQDANFLQLFTGNMHLVLEKHASYSYCDLVGQHIGILFKQILRMGIQNKLINILRQSPAKVKSVEFFSFDLNRVGIPHPLFKCIAFTTVKKEIKGDKENTFLSDLAVLVQRPKIFQSLRTLYFAACTLFSHRELSQHSVFINYLMGKLKKDSISL